MQVRQGGRTGLDQDHPRELAARVDLVAVDLDPEGCGRRSPRAVALHDREAAAEVYEDLMPLRGLAGGASSLSVVFRPVAQTLGELARFLGRPEPARSHYLEAVRVAAAWDSPLWTAAAGRACPSCLRTRTGFVFGPVDRVTDPSSGRTAPRGRGSARTPVP
ncbi:hypothetical protein [Streptomyces sp. NPDC005533]|uniref:hypothetical protein n=1 Tax=Streptomyces sp. NPDC005533 TaxID=3364723 RepID=UPI0036C72340